MLHVFLVWFGLDILRLVNKKAFFKILNGSILFDLLSSRKITTAKLSTIDINRSDFALISKRCRTLVLSKRGQKLYRKTDFLGT
jgi:hypothetical protein